MGNPGSDKQYFLQIDGEIRPVSYEQISQMLENNQIDFSESVSEDRHHWLKLSQHPDFHSHPMMKQSVKLPTTPNEVPSSSNGKKHLKPEPPEIHEIESFVDKAFKLKKLASVGVVVFLLLGLSIKTLFMSSHKPIYDQQADSSKKEAKTKANEPAKIAQPARPTKAKRLPASASSKNIKVIKPSAVNKRQIKTAPPKMQWSDEEAALPNGKDLDDNQFAKPMAGSEDQEPYPEDRPYEEDPYRAQESADNGSPKNDPALVQEATPPVQDAAEEQDTDQEYAEFDDEEVYMDEESRRIASDLDEQEMGFSDDELETINEEIDPEFIPEDDIEEDLY